MNQWLEEVTRLEVERDEEAKAKADSNREILEETSEWIRREVEPAMNRFADDLRSIGRIVEVHISETMGRVEVRDSMGIVVQFAAEVGTESDYSTEVRDQLPTMSAVFHGVERNEVKGDRIYELLKTSYLSKIKSRPA